MFFKSHKATMIAVGMALLSSSTFAQTKGECLADEKADNIRLIAHCNTMPVEEVEDCLTLNVTRHNTQVAFCNTLEP